VTSNNNFDVSYLPSSIVCSGTITFVFVCFQGNSDLNILTTCVRVTVQTSIFSISIEKKSTLYATKSDFASSETNDAL
jgi:hypothetical protein